MENARSIRGGLAGSKRRFSYLATVVSGMSDAPDSEVQGAGPDSWRTSWSCINYACAMILVQGILYNNRSEWPIHSYHAR